MPVTNVQWTDYNNTRHIESAETVLERSLNDPFWKYPYPVLHSMLEDLKGHDRPKGISVTQLLWGCLRCEVLMKYEPYTLDLELEWPKFRGTLMHGMLEGHAPEGSIVETRFSAPVPGLPGSKLSGKPDTIVKLKDGTWAITDLKTVRQIPKYDRPYSHHVEQLQMYRWLVNHATEFDTPMPDGVLPQDINITRMGLIYMDNEGVKPLEVRTTSFVATQPGAKNATRTVKVPDVWKDEEVEALLVDRYATLQEAYDEYEKDGRLPSYPPGFDYIRAWPHRYKPTAERCVHEHFTGN